jgi:putative flavoprotein involved in K+ transport
VEIERLTAHEVVFSDGTSLKTDILVLATGYQPLQEAARVLFGDEVADRVGPIWGFGPEYELRNTYGRTPQDGFYFTGGGFMGCRSYSPYTARLIKASLEGLMPPRMAAATRETADAVAESA